MPEPPTISLPPQLAPPDLDTEAITGRYQACPDPIFVGGLMRSGTSLVMKLLLAHQECTGLNQDAHIVGTLLESWMSHEVIADAYTNINLALGHDADRLHRFVRSNYFFMYEHLALPIFESRLVEKTPGSEGHFPQLLPVFSDATLVSTLRHPHDTMRSALAHALLFQVGPLNEANVPSGFRQQALALATKPLRSGTQDCSDLQIQIEARLHFSHLIRSMVDSLLQLQSIGEQLGDRLIVVHFDALLKDMEPHARTLLERCGLDASPTALRQAIDGAGQRGEEKIFWRELLDWSEMEFERRFHWALNDAQRARLDRDVVPLYERLVEQICR